MFDGRPLSTALVIVVAFGVTTPSFAERSAPRYKLDPVTDTAISAAALLIAVFSQVAIDSGELSAQEPGPTSKLPGFDRWVAETDHFVEGSKITSTIGMAGMGALAAVDAVLTGVKAGTRAGFTDVVMYAETTLINMALVNIVKLTVRRPRPEAYWQARNGAGANGETNLELSFYSGHSAITAGLAATASYLSFRRYGPGWRSFTTLAIGVGLTSFVAVERVRALSHFPSDVITGAIVGGAVGVLVPHFHFMGYKNLRPVAAPIRGGARVALQGAW